MFPPLALLVGSGADQLALQMLLVFGAAKLLAELATRAGMPGIVGGLLSGILLGPSLLNLIRYNDLLHALSELGVMFLLFQVGLEVKVSELLRVGKTALLVAISGVAVPFAMGYAIYIGAKHPQPEALFMGAAMVATSVGITAQVLSSKGLLEHRTAKIILGAAIIDDVLGLLVLAVVSSMGEGRGIDYTGLLTTTVVSVVFVAAIVKYGTGAVRIVVPRLARGMRLHESEYAIAVTFLFGMALLASVSGVAAIIGAFLAGMALAEIASKRLHTLVQGAGELMIPFFLASIGLQLDLHALASGSSLAMAIAILIAALNSKALGCGLAAWRLGWKDAARIGIGMAPRGEIGMVIAQIGMSRSAIGQEAYGVAVFMAVMTTVVAPPLLDLAYKDIAQPPRGLPPDEEPVQLG